MLISDNLHIPFDINKPAVDNVLCVSVNVAGIFISVYYKCVILPVLMEGNKIFLYQLVMGIRKLFVSSFFVSVVC